MRDWVKTAFFTSAFAPTLLAVAVARFWATTCFSIDIAAYASIGIGGVLVAFALLNYIDRKAETFSFSAKKIESNDMLMIGVLVTYFIPLLVRASDINWKVMLGLAALVILISRISSQIPPHPVLRLMKLRFYKVESSAGVVYTLLSRLRDSRI